VPSLRRLQAARSYLPRTLETPLYRTVARELEAFLSGAAGRDQHLPDFVVQTFADFLACGDPAHGFVHLRCTDCGHERAVAFSCKRRGVCTSCAGRRMNEVAQHLTRNVLPHHGIRQWVLSLPYSLRYRLAYDRTLVGPVLDAFVRAIFFAHRRRVRARHAVGRHVDLQPGAITFVQRFGGAINLNVHFHTLVLDGLYAVDHKVGTIEFLPLPAPTHDEVLAVLTDAAARIARRLTWRGLGDDIDPQEADPLARDNALLARLYAASVEGRVPDGERAGQRTARFGGPVERFVLAATTSAARSAVAAGMSLHAGVFVPGTDRERLERLCRYTARPSVAVERLHELPDGRVTYELRHAWHDGTTHVVFEPRELLARLVAQIPPPRAHQLRYHGILAPAAAYRAKVVPSRNGHGAAESSHVPAASRPSWAVLLRHTFAVDALACPRCGGRMRPLGVVTDDRDIEAVLAGIYGARAP
jgi:hypothetical protein